MAWIWKGGSARERWCKSCREGEEGGWVVAPWMKMRSVFGTCMVSGIRRREKVREWDRRSSRGVQEGGGGELSDGSTGFCWGRWTSQRHTVWDIEGDCRQIIYQLSGIFTSRVKVWHGGTFKFSPSVGTSCTRAPSPAATDTGARMWANTDAERDNEPGGGRHGNDRGKKTASV